MMMHSMAWASQHVAMFDETDSLHMSGGDVNRQNDSGSRSKNDGPAENFKMLGPEFNPLKFDFVPMRELNSVKLEFDDTEMGIAQARAGDAAVDTRQLDIAMEQGDLLEMLPEYLGPQFSNPLVEASMSFYDDASHRLHYDAHMVDQPASSLDDATLSLLDSLELKVAPSTSDAEPSVSIPPVDIDMFKKTSLRLALNSTEDVVSTGLLRDVNGLDRIVGVNENSPEQLRIVRNKAAQKRYRMRKKTEARRQINVLENAKADLLAAESKAPAHHVVVIDKNLLLRKLNKERDEELIRLRKVLADIKSETEALCTKMVKNVKDCFSLPSPR